MEDTPADDGRPLTVKDFGAKGDGVTDDTEAIQAMLVATGSVKFDTGDYVYTGPSLPATPTVEASQLRIDTFDNASPGTQFRCTVRITHLPTGIVVTSDEHESQYQARQQAMQVLRRRLESGE